MAQKPEVKDGKVNYVLNAAAWEATKGDVYGGQSDIVTINVGDVAGVFTYVGHQQISTDLGDTTAHSAMGPDGKPVRLPIAATFLKALDQAGIRKGDKFIVKRDSDIIKKKGAGKDKPMAIYAVKVTERAPEVEDNVS